MSSERLFFVYILASNTRVLYTGVTRDLRRRVYQHKHKVIPGFTSTYSVARLVYYEATNNSRAAVAREREIKSWTREKKLRLIETVNAGWIDLAADWFRIPPGKVPRSARDDKSLRSG